MKKIASALAVMLLVMFLSTPVGAITQLDVKLEEVQTAFEEVKKLTPISMIYKMWFFDFVGENIRFVEISSSFLNVIGVFDNWFITEYRIGINGKYVSSAHYSVDSTGGWHLTQLLDGTLSIPGNTYVNTKRTVYGYLADVSTLELPEYDSLVDEDGNSKSIYYLYQEDDPFPTYDPGKYVGDGSYLVNGFEVSDLLPMRSAIMDNVKEGRKFGMFAFAVLLVCLIASRFIKRAVDFDFIGNTGKLDTYNMMGDNVMFGIMHKNSLKEFKNGKK